MIHIVGAPMAGYRLEFKRNYAINLTLQLYTRLAIRQINSQHIVPDSDPQAPLVTDSSPKCAIEVAATQIPPSAISQNFLAPVNDTTNRRCQEWTMDYVHHLVHHQYLNENAIQIVQSARDPPNHGVGLNPVGGGRGRGRGQ
ncbi:uncharacterized protein BDCG_05782 [Blastomyces dermatitidis ER-3]|uniref:Uncharacterized protein n=2 Tax=Ajellomyces dermatitidis TaxID=5039 RepID=F2TDV7_AJEDA|nr:uncharacterized protein BDCG_05782 [Blastomyces dermatitidis ER-3]EEQ90662.2 hypothetical protein BDCG_05782 [Blastomyces dermatitidis ER-3]EGE81420.1 hypothetical protein BDDG_04362 [Blastomyces dermatitidis ATCC 18188]EQL29173.1 hypothetical protein BDFG_08166 [Blastomyces dermatitidis ATCC 26199]